MCCLFRRVGECRRLFPRCVAVSSSPQTPPDPGPWTKKKKKKSLPKREDDEMAICAAQYDNQTKRLHLWLCLYTVVLSAKC